MAAETSRAVAKSQLASPRYRNEFGSRQRPAGTIFTFDDVCGLGRIPGLHVGAVPFDGLASPEGNTAKEHDFRELGADVKTGIAILRLVRLDGRNPLKVLPVIAVAFELIPGQRFRDGGRGVFLFVVNELFVVFPFDEKLFAVVVRRKNLSLVADDQTAAAGNFAAKGFNVHGEILRRLVAAVMLGRVVGQRLAAVIPPERCGRKFDGVMTMEKSPMRGWNRNFAFRKFKSDFGADGISFPVDAVNGHRFDFCRITKAKCAERHIDRVAGHVAQGAGAEILPATPVEGMIDVLFERPGGSRSEPDVPFHRFRYGVAAIGTVHSLRPDRTIGPDMNFLNISNDPGLNAFHRPAQAIR